MLLMEAICIKENLLRGCHELEAVPFTQLGDSAPFLVCLGIRCPYSLDFAFTF